MFDRGKLELNLQPSKCKMTAKTNNLFHNESYSEQAVSVVRLE